MASGFVGFGGDDGDGDDEPGLLQGFAGAEEGAIETGGVEQHFRREVGGECEREAELGGKTRAEIAGAEEGDGDVAVLAGERFDGLVGVAGAEVGAEFREKLREIVAGLAEVAAEGAHGVEVTAGCAAQTEVDAAGVESFEGAELLGDDQRSVVGEHDAAASDADGAGGGGDVSDEDGGRGAGEAFNGVVLSQPETAVTPMFCVTSKVDRAGDGGGWGFAGAHADEVED